MWNTGLLCSDRNHVLQKKKTLEKKSFLAVDYVQIIESYIVHTRRHM